MNQKQIEIVTEFCQKHTAGRKGTPSDERLNKTYAALMAMYHAVEQQDYVMMGLTYEELSVGVKYPSTLITAAMQVLGEKANGKTTPKTTAVIANYRKRFRVLIDFANRVAEAGYEQ